MFETHQAPCLLSNITNNTPNKGEKNSLYTQSNTNERNRFISTPHKNTYKHVCFKRTKSFHVQNQFSNGNIRLPRMLAGNSNKLDENLSPLVALYRLLLARTYPG